MLKKDPEALGSLRRRAVRCCYTQGCYKPALPGSMCQRTGGVWWLLSCSYCMRVCVCVKLANLAFFLLNVQHKQGILKCNFSAGTRGNKLLPGCS